MKCEICGKKISTTFLEKIFGTIVKDENGKRHAICNDCQKIHTIKKDVLSNLSK